jgi:ankyrin repeat protein
MPIQQEIYDAITLNEQEELENLITKDNVNNKVKDGYAIHYAVFKNNLPITRFLIETGADVNARFEDGSTPLITAAEYGYTDLCRLLLKHHAKVNETDFYGNDALVKAVLYGRTEIVELLLKHGADPFNNRVKGKTATDLATDMNLHHILTLLDQEKKAN